MKKLKGKCRTCLGCNILDEVGFQGRKKCKNYIRANSINWFLLIVAMIELLIIGFAIYELYIWFNIKIGG